MPDSASVLTIRGNPYDRGRIYGSHARDLIRRGVAHYVGMWQRNTGKSEADLFDRVVKFKPVVADYDDLIMQEIEGIAAGAKLPLNEVLLLNARYEIMLVAFFAGGGAAARGECTSLAAAAEATTDGHTYVAQNWDITAEAGQRCVLLEVLQDDRPNIVAHVEAGFVGHKGLNSAGLGICVNAIGSQHDEFSPRVPVWVLARGALNCTTIDEAQHALDRAERAASINFTIGSNAGEVAALEVTPVDVERVAPVNGRIAHANVFCDLREGRGITDELARRFPVFADRAERARELINGAEVNLETLMEMFKDRANVPESICRHAADQPPEAPEALCMETVASIIMDLTDRTVHITDGPPDRGEYRKHTFESLRGTGRC